VDRGNANLAARFTPLHPAVLRLIRSTVEAGKKGGLHVSVCGEMASHPLMAFALIGLGVRELSVNGRSVPLVKRVAFQPSYIWENNRVRGLRDMNYLQFGLIVSTK